MSKQFDFGKVLGDELGNIEEVPVPEETAPTGGFVLKPKEPKEKSKYKYNFPLYISKESGDRLSAIASDNNYKNRNELIVEMINSALANIGEKPIE